MAGVSAQPGALSVIAPGVGLAEQGVQSGRDAALGQVQLQHVAYKATAFAQVRDVSLAEAAGRLIDGVVPIRQPMQYRGQWSKPGWYYFAYLEKHISYESRFEAAHLLLLDFAGGVRDVIPQPFRLHWRQGKAARRHTPDYLVERVSGSDLVLDVKGTARAADPKNALVFDVTRLACMQMGLDYRVATDIRMTLLQNVQWLAGYKTPALLEGSTGTLIGQVTHPVSCQEAASRAARSLGTVVPLVLPTLFHLCWRRALSIDLSEPFTGRTQVGPAGLFPLVLT